MAHVSFISSMGVRVFFGLEKMLRLKNRHMYLCAVQPEVRKILEITGFPPDIHLVSHSRKKH